MHSSLLYNSFSRLILSTSVARKSPERALGGLLHMLTRQITSVLFSPMPRSGRTDDDICQSGHVRLAFIMHASLLCIARTTGRMYCDFYGRPPRPFKHAQSFRETLTTSLSVYSSWLWSGTKNDITVLITSICTRRDKPRSFMIHIVGSFELSTVARSKLREKRTWQNAQNPSTLQMWSSWRYS